MRTTFYLVFGLFNILSHLLTPVLAAVRPECSRGILRADLSPKNYAAKISDSVEHCVFYARTISERVAVVEVLMATTSQGHK